MNELEWRPLLPECQLPFRGVGWCLPKPCTACASYESVVLLPCSRNHWGIDYTTRLNTLEHIFSFTFCLRLLSYKNKALSSMSVVSVLGCSPQQQVCIKQSDCTTNVIPCATTVTCDIKGCKYLQPNMCQYVSTVTFVTINLHISCSLCCLPYLPHLWPFLDHLE